MADFIRRHQAELEGFARVSRALGARADYTQGGGGNTSVKLAGGLMAIKASGFRLTDVAPDAAYAVLDGAALREFYNESDPASFKDVEAAGSERARALTQAVEGMAPLRPSVEAGFHSLLPRYVGHTHSVYANMAACADGARELAARALEGAPYAWAFVPYVNPGAQLTFTMRDVLREVAAREGREASVVVMQNHGLIAAADTADECLFLHEDANTRFRKLFGVDPADYPLPRVRAEGDGFVSDTPWLVSRLKGGAYTAEALTQAPLFPDQMVYFRGTLGESAIIDPETGVTRYQGPQASAQTLEETLCAVVFIHETLKKKGLRAVPMGEAAQGFIQGWESEKYRKQLSEGK